MKRLYVSFNGEGCPLRHHVPLYLREASFIAEGFVQLVDVLDDKADAVFLDESCLGAVGEAEDWESAADVFEQLVGECHVDVTLIFPHVEPGPAVVVLRELTEQSSRFNVTVVVDVSVLRCKVAVVVIGVRVVDVQVESMVTDGAEDGSQVVVVTLEARERSFVCDVDLPVLR